MGPGISLTGALGALLVGVTFCTVTVTAFSRQEIIKSLLNSSSYDSRIPPNYEDNFPTNITIQLFILSFDSVKETSMDYSVTVFVRVKWSDQRLQWEDKVLDTLEDHHADPNDPTVGSHTMAEHEVLGHLEVDTKLLDSVWMPDIYFVNDKKAKVHDVTMINRMLQIFRNGSIQTSSRISMTLSCDMHLKRYPHDEQTCSLAIGSYSYSAENVLFHWHEDPVLIREGVTLPRFNVRLGTTSLCEYSFGVGSMVTGHYTCIKADFELRREFGYYVAQVYVPSCLIVMLSWVSFWIDLDAIPARVSLGLLTVLTMTTHSTGEKATLPKVSYVKAIDVWMAGCLAFVFAALLEFAYVNVQSRVEKRYRGGVGTFVAPDRSSRGNNDVPSRDLCSPAFGIAAAAAVAAASSGGTSVREGGRGGDLEDKDAEIVETFSRWNVLKRRFLAEREDIKGLKRARLVDKCSRVLFPLAFLVFNAVYWVSFKAAPL